MKVKYIKTKKRCKLGEVEFGGLFTITKCEKVYMRTTPYKSDEPISFMLDLDSGFLYPLDPELKVVKVKQVGRLAVVDEQYKSIKKEQEEERYEDPDRPDWEVSKGDNWESFKSPTSETGDDYWKSFCRGLTGCDSGCDSGCNSGCNNE